jgi:integrase
MTAFVRGKSGIKSIYVPTRQGGLVQRSTGTSDPRIVRDMKRMADEIRDKHLWSILDALQANRIKLPAVYQSHVANQLPQLAAQLSAVNLSGHLVGWIAWVRAQRSADVRTADVYWQQVTALIPDGGSFLLPDLTRARVIAWLTGMTCSSGTKRKYLYALKSFVRYLLDVNVLTIDPLAGLKAPKKNAARDRWETVANDERIVTAALPKYRPLFAAVKAVGCDLGSAIDRAQKGDFDLKARTMNVRGTKTDRRKVHRATIEPWAIPYLTEHLRSVVGPHTLVFASLSRHGASHHHARCCEAVGVEDYTLKDSRHSVAVRMRLAGKSFEQIAAQLGTSVFQAVTVYSRYTPEEAADAARKANG